MGILKKFNQTDYNSILENILDSKYFPSNSKSLLLSMIYKVENVYSDYQSVKALDTSKDEFINNILEIIRKYLINIKLVEPDSRDAKILRDNNLLALTNEKERVAIAYPTEAALLYAISDVFPKYFYMPDSFEYKNAFQNLLVNGYNQNVLEVLTDFSGWSWDVNVIQKISIGDFLIYQNLIMIMGEDFLDEWLRSKEKTSIFLDTIKREFANTKFFENLCKYLVLNLLPKEKAKALKDIERKKKELEEISNKPVYFERLKQAKLRLLKELEKIDFVLNNKDLMRKEYMAKNAKLDTKNRIPTLGTYKKKLEERRVICVDRIAEYTAKISPVNYINYKRELEESIRVSSEGNENTEELLIGIQKEFINAIDDWAYESVNPEELKQILFKLRYYRFLYVTEKKQVKDYNELEIPLQAIMKGVSQKLIEYEVIKKISSNNELNQEIIYNVLDTKMINLLDVRIELKQNGENLTIKTYEKEVYEKEFSMHCGLSKRFYHVRFDKPFKLFT